MALADELTGSSYAPNGREFGGRHHSTILACSKVIDQRSGSGDHFGFVRTVGFEPRWYCCKRAKPRSRSLKSWISTILPVPYRPASSVLSFRRRIINFESRGNCSLVTTIPASDRQQWRSGNLSKATTARRKVTCTLTTADAAASRVLWWRRFLAALGHIARHAIHAIGGHKDEIMVI
jgi:hypothetical protein